MGVMDLVALGCRITQFIFAVITLGLVSYTAHWYNAHSTYQDSPSRVNFLIFVSLWTLLALLYLALSPRFFPSMAHKYAILGLDFLTMVFWFAGWVALAVYKENLILCGGRICHVMTAAIVFGALEWLLFMASTALAGLHAWRTRGMGSKAPEKNTGASVSSV
ncbi:hypothetical protein G7Y79_00001g003270 [Physcia stellaris]|nr:hypothetical protein G7Y79_00001g003270 [Physcia stellaris]